MSKYAVLNVARICVLAWQAHTYGKPYVRLSRLSVPCNTNHAGWEHSAVKACCKLRKFCQHTLQTATPEATPACSVVTTQSRCYTSWLPHALHGFCCIAERCDYVFAAHCRDGCRSATVRGVGFSYCNCRTAEDCWPCCSAQLQRPSFRMLACYFCRTHFYI